VPVFQKPTRGSDAHLQVVLVGAWPQSNFLDFRYVLILLRVAGALVLLKAKLTKVGNSAHGRTGARGDLDQIEARLLGASERVFNRHHADLLAVVAHKAHLGNANLPIGARARRHRRT
jgi:hypothetical protein